MKIGLSSYLVLFIFWFVPPLILSGQETKADSTLFFIKSQRLENRDYKKDAKYISALLDLAVEKRYQNLDSLYLLTNEAKNLMRKFNVEEVRSRIYYNFGIYYSGKGNREQAIKNLELAINNPKQKNNRLKLDALDELAFEHEKNGDYAAALKNYLVLLELAKTVGNKQTLLSANANLASLYFQLSDYEQSLQYYQKAEKIGLQVGNPISSAKTASNIVHLKVDMGNFDDAIAKLDSCITIFKKNKEFVWLAYAYRVKGKIFLKQESFENALAMYEIALFGLDKSNETKKSLVEDYYTAKVKSEIAESYLGLGKIDEAIKYAEEAYNISKKLDHKLGLSDSERLFFLIAEENKNFEKALFHYKQYDKLTEEINDAKNKNEVTLLKAKREYEQDKQNLIIENDLNIRRQKNFAYLFLAGLIFSLIILVITKHSAKKQRLLNEKLVVQQRQLKKNEAALKLSNLTKEKLFSVIGHDLKEPIYSFQQLFEMYHEGKIEEKEIVAFLPALEQKIDRIGFTLANLLQWGLTQMNGFTTSPKNSNLHKLVLQTFDYISKLADKKSIQLINAVTKDIFIYADNDNMEIVLRNLVSNAIKFTPENGSISISSLGKNRMVEVCIKDTGVGIAKESLVGIFGDFNGKTTQGTNMEKGTGFGLSLCKELIELNNGDIRVESIPNEGSSFYFTIPKGKSS